MAADKVLLTHKGALRAKYEAAGLKALLQAVDRLIAADAARQVTTRLVCIDLKGDMDPLGGAKVTDATDEKQVKDAVDAVYAALEPAYLVLLGAPDVVPHQTLANPLDDDDLDVPSDLPYACAAPYGTDPSEFTAPSRVVGRLPDVVGGSDASYLEGLLDTAAGWRRRKRQSYDSYFAVTADVWKGSTRMTVRKLFGTTDKLELSPPEGPSWTKSRLRRRSHFFNLHGALEDDCYYGEGSNQTFPEAHLASRLAGRLREGTVIAAECCYGAELFDPAVAGMGATMVNAYLEEKAYGFFGSSTVAYGPAEGNGAADLICQFFLREVLKGASIGRAALMARQAFVAQESPLDPIDLKTLVQFHLMGDASIHPAHLPAPEPKAAVEAKTPAGRKGRRRRMKKRARDLSLTTAHAETKPKRGVPKELRQLLVDLAKKHELVSADGIKRYVVHGPEKPKGAAPLPKQLAAKAAKAKAASSSQFFVMVAKRDSAAGEAAATEKGASAPTTKKVAKKGGSKKAVSKAVEGSGSADSKSAARAVEAMKKRPPVMVAHEKDGEIEEVRVLLPR